MQEGRYGKINKCISFPEMLDMIPFMTRTGDVPPLYMLYAVIVHLDTLNASFSGHYISYVKDLRGNWYRIDDSEVNYFFILIFLNATSQTVYEHMKISLSADSSSTNDSSYVRRSLYVVLHEVIK